MTYEEKEKQEQKAREITAGKLAKIAEILGYSFDEERRALNPPNEYLPNLHCRYCDYRTRDKIEITSHANNFNKIFATITVSQARSVESLASDIKRRAAAMRNSSCKLYPALIILCINRAHISH